MLGTVLGSVNQSQATRRTVNEDVTRSSNHVSEETTIGGVESTWGLDSTSRTQRKTLELAGRIGKKTPKNTHLTRGLLAIIYQLKNVRARGLCIDPGRACEREELKMANGSVVQTAGYVKILLKCGA